MNADKNTSIRLILGLIILLFGVGFCVKTFQNASRDMQRLKQKYRDLETLKNLSWQTSEKRESLVREQLKKAGDFISFDRILISKWPSKKASVKLLTPPEAPPSWKTQHTEISFSGVDGTAVLELINSAETEVNPPWKLLLLELNGTKNGKMQFQCVWSEE